MPFLCPMFVTTKPTFHSLQFVLVGIVAASPRLCFTTWRKHRTVRTSLCMYRRATQPSVFTKNSASKQKNLRWISTRNICHSARLTVHTLSFSVSPGRHRRCFTYAITFSFAFYFYRVLAWALKPMFKLWFTYFVFSLRMMFVGLTKPNHWIKVHWEVNLIRFWAGTGYLHHWLPTLQLHRQRFRRLRNCSRLGLNYTTTIARKEKKNQLTILQSLPRAESINIIKREFVFSVCLLVRESLKSCLVNDSCDERSFEALFVYLICDSEGCHDNRTEGKRKSRWSQLDRWGILRKQLISDESTRNIFRCGFCGWKKSKHFFLFLRTLLYLLCNISCEIMKKIPGGEKNCFHVSFVELNFI